jgi:hypothetical protein
MKHLLHVAKGALVVVIAAIPAIVADPSAGHYVTQHPWLAAYLPVAAGVIRAIVKARQAGTSSTSPKLAGEASRAA